MICLDKSENAIIAVRDVLVLARKLAYENTDTKVIASLLDRAEYLPSLILDQHDRTHEFRDQIKEISDEFSWNTILERFDS